MAIDQRTAPYAALLLRVTLGVYAILHIYWKFYILPGGLDAWWTNLNNQGYPNWVVLYVLSGEFLGALLLIPGIYTRWVALYTVPLIVGAAQYWLVRKGFFFVYAGAELPTLWAIALIVQAGLGDGAYALIPSPAFPFIGSQRRTMPAE
jgi:putative oxidoreductase